MPTKTHDAIHHQPDDLRALLASQWETAEHAAAIIGTADRVVISGIGTSHHAALYAGWLLRAAGIDANVVHAFDFANYPISFPFNERDVLIVFGHTGNTTFTKLSLTRGITYGITVIAIGGNDAIHDGAQVILRTVDPEQSTTYTTSHLTALAAMAMIATVIGETRGISAFAGFRSELETLPEKVSEILGRQAEIIAVARKAITARTYAIGAGPNEITAIELMIKVREAAFAPIDGMAAEQFLHGPIVAVNAGDLAIVIHSPGAASERTEEITKVLQEIGADLWIVGAPVAGVAAPHFSLPVLPELLSPLLSLIPMQLLASQLAVMKGANPDQFRCDDPIYLREFSMLTF